MIVINISVIKCYVEGDQMSVFGLADGTQGSDQKGSLADKLLIILLCTFCFQWVLSCPFWGKGFEKSESEQIY